LRHLILVLTAILFHCALAQSAAQSAGLTEVSDARAAYETLPSEVSREQLMSVLSAYQGKASVETVSAYMALLTSDVISGDSGKIAQTAIAATRHFEPIAALIPQQYLKARYLKAEAQFKRSQSAEALIDMAHVEGAAKAYRTSDLRRPDWAKSLYWQAQAWRMTMQAYALEQKRGYPDTNEVNAILKSYEVELDRVPSETDSRLPELPVCDGRLIQSPKLRPPRRNVYPEIGAAVILRFGQDAAGRVIDPEVLASVPSNEFDESLLETVAKWKFRPAKRKQVDVTCRLSRTNVVMPVIFR